MRPVAFYISRGWRITSSYGSRKDPITGKPGVFHHGIDFGGKPAGTPIEAPCNGTVRAAGYYGHAGNAVSVLSDKTGVVLLFFHMQRLSVKQGQKITAGDIIGTNGSTGKTTGPHLHFEIRHDKGLLFGSRRPAWGDPRNYSED